jgi:hypothetical protein
MVMAGDWIKMRVDLQDDPSVVALCDQLDLDEFQVIGRLHKLWGWADTHTADGVTSGVTPKWVDRYVSHQGFSEALISVGWLCFEDGVLSFPGFNIHNGASAKSRCDATIRKRVSRERHAGVTNGGDNLPTIPRPFVRAVLNRDSYTCVYCGTKSDAAKEESKKSLLSIDHIIPASRGSGRQAIEDLATCCKQCNNEKNDRTPDEWGILPTFVSLNYEYRNGTIVTKICDSIVTREDKSREDEIREELENEDTASAVTPADVLSQWNSKMNQKCRMTDKRKATARLRLKNADWASTFTLAIDRCAASDFCNGRTQGGSWVADFEWFLKPDSATKLIEGKYDNRNGKVVSAGVTHKEMVIDANHGVM